MEPQDELTLRLAFTRLSRLQPSHHRLLYAALGSAVDLYNSIGELEKYVPNATSALREELGMIDSHLKWAEDEIRYCHDNGIEILCFDSPRFPALLNHCDDAPTVLYSLGKVDYNSPHMIAAVGTRHCTEYGKAVCRSFCADLSHSLPDAVIVSGLAYGIDIASHRAAIASGLPTVAVLAHGLNEIYPSVHRPDAKDIIKHGGGLLTEYPRQTRICKRNFVSRNRIVAGMSHATLVVESAEKGGSLITASLAFDYSRDVFACPGRVGDPLSKGCNNLICDQKARLFTGADGMIKDMGWERDSRVVQGELFPAEVLSDEEQLVYSVFKRIEQANASVISREIGRNLQSTLALLSRMELAGRVCLVAGDNYRWA